MIDTGAAGTTTALPQGQPQQPQQGPLGFNLHDPMHVALLLSPLAEVLRHGAGAAIYHAALGGMQYREQFQERQREFNTQQETIRQGRQDVANQRMDAATALAIQRRDEAIRHATELENRTPGSGKAYLKAIGLSDAELPEFPTSQQPTPPTFGQVHPGFQNTPLANQPVPLNAHGQVDYPSIDAAARMHGIQTTAPEGPESPQKRLDRLRVELPKLVASGDPAAEARIRQIAPILGLDPAASVAELQRNVGEKGLKTKTAQATLGHIQAETTHLGTLTANAGGTTKLSTQERAALNEYQRIEAKQDSLRKQAGGLVMAPGQTEKLSAQADSLDNRLGAILKQFPNLRPIVGAPAPQDFSVQRGMTQQGLPQGRPAPAGATSAAPTVPAKSGGKSMTLAEVNSIAQRRGISVDEVKRQAKAQGYTLSP